MKMPFRFFLLLFLTQIFSACSVTQEGGGTDQPLRIAFYNVENLFDTEDDPLTLDDDFTPTGKQEWTIERYRTKLDRIHEVAKGLHYPALLGLCEVENKKVLDDLCQTGSMADYKYESVHFDSPDKRGIDVALLYQKKEFKVKGSEIVRIDFPKDVTPDEPGYSSRDLLVVNGVLPNKTEVYVLVAHFPSRRGGVAESEPKRVHVANYLKKKVEDLTKANPTAQFIIMGDFNDETTNKSMARTLQAYPLPTAPTDGRLYNCFSQLDANGEGSYNFRGEWNMLDQIILSHHFFQTNNSLQFQSAHIFKEEFLLYQDKKNGPRPNRTYGGPRYFGGYSDHLPVFVEMKSN